ncbi:glycoside hydrolase family 3 C-terminal domain-containing protein [Actinomadura gamaensis]|uniref:Glycoside hydrolase family 3 C-terminal domain-containing protein n=1 Tax=Actinomadura gamaensis TaxID=1763541 RepID=A0ABV9TUB5_9ACTN
MDQSPAADASAAEAISPGASAAGLSLPERASLTSGSGTWTTTAVPSAVREITVSDGPHGIRRQDAASGDALGLLHSLPATCFPPAVTLGSSWDPDLARRIGAALAAEAASLGVDVVLGPGVNIKRSPLCGRNFEYFSEDPHLTGVMGAALVEGVQSGGVGACVKHFAVNNQETDRMRVNAEVDERTLREIYLAAFEHIVRTARPWTVMTSYNRINGVYASENRWLLTDLLRGEWGFDGLVMSDWGAVNDRVAAVAAGLDLEMPPTGTDDQIVAAVADGRLAEDAVTAAAQRVLDLARRTERTAPPPPWSPDEHHALAREAAAASAVLLKNDGVLPLAPGVRVAVLGELARTPRYQGHGSSHVVPTRLDDAWSVLAERLGGRAAFAAGYRLDGTDDPGLLREAVDAAAGADVALLFLGLPAEEESEGFDRTHLDLPAVQLGLLDAVAATGTPVVVVLANGGVVSVAPWRDGVAAILETWLPGQAGGSATADLLLGVTSPSGRLTETIPLRLADTPSYLHFPGSDGRVVYGEGRYVGYRYHQTLDVPVAYPFGHGLTYSRFGHSALDAVRAGDGWEVGVTVTNEGDRFAHEVVQLYVGPDGPHADRPRRELRGFRKVGLEPGASARVTFELRPRDFAEWSVSRGRWSVPAGTFRVEIGASAADVRLATTVTCDGDGHVDELGPMSTLREWLDHPVGSKLLRDALSTSPTPRLGQGDSALVRLALGIPLKKFQTFGIGLSTDVVDRLVAAVRDHSAREEQPACGKQSAREEQDAR